MNYTAVDVTVRQPSRGLRTFRRKFIQEPSLWGCPWNVTTSKFQSAERLRLRSGMTITST